VLVRAVLYRSGMSNRRTSEEGGGPSTVQSVDRAAHILQLLARLGEAGVTEIATELEVHKSTAFRLMSALEVRDLVTQVGERGKYRLGIGIVRLAGATIARLDVVQEARPVCRELAARSGETVNLAVLSDGAVLYLDQAAGATAIQLHNWVGQRVPAHATANGRVLLSGLSDAQVVELLGTVLPTYTHATLATSEALLEALGQVRSDGWAVAVDELEVGLTAVAAPVRSLHGDIVASVSLSGPTFRLPTGPDAEVVAQVRAAATEVSRRMGWGEA
jgi:DNA-binding IclR family transcriptional regulator